MKRYQKVLKEGWKYTTAPQKTEPYDAYHLTKTGAQTNAHAVSFDDSGWQETSVPRDLTADAPLDARNNDFNGYIRRPDLWFRRGFLVEERLRGKRILLRFHGVTGVSEFCVNGCLMAVSRSSFCGVELDISDVVRFGAAVNVVSVHSCNQTPEGWWYQGTGLYRPVELVALEEISLDDDFLQIKTAFDGTAWTLSGSGALHGRREAAGALTVRTVLLDADGHTVAQTCAAPEGDRFAFQMTAASPMLWDIGQGNLYTCRLTLLEDGAPLDETEVKTGFRTIRFDPQEGFFLNGVRREIRGMCYHEDEGNLGLHTGAEVYRRRIEHLLAMGGNAYRCSHNAPARELLDLCDQYGVLVMDETRRFDTGAVAMAELEYLVRRDRNHPCVILWSIGNEEPWQGDDRGYRIAKTMRDRVWKLDGTRPVTMAMHNGFHAVSAAAAVDVVGVNYNHTDYDKIRALFPEKPFVASEILNLADGVYENGNPYSGTDGAFETLQAIAARPWISGSFGWAGQEYRGEHRNLAFFTDCCPVSCIGTRKDGFYRYQAMWTQEPMVHLCGHWNHTPGSLCRVSVYSNTEEVALYQNGAPVGRAPVDDRYEAVFELPFAPGELKAVGMRNGLPAAADTRRTCGPVTALRLRPERTTLDADGLSTVSIEVAAVDADGNVTPTGSYLFTASVEGGAELLCCDNADPYCSTFPEANTSVLYHGYGKIVLRSGLQHSPVTVRADCPELEGGSCVLTLLPAENRLLPKAENLFVNDWFVSHTWREEPDIYAYTEDIHYVTWQKYVEPAFSTAKERPFCDRGGYVIYCMEPNMPPVSPDRIPALVLEGVAGDAKLLVSTRDYNNTVGKQFYLEKTDAALGPVRMELPGVQTGDRMILKLVVHGTAPESGLLGAVRFEV
ncbi:MAG: glycoside hydrolase family 2 protein [Candidatus Avoscillospira sp.]